MAKHYLDLTGFVCPLPLNEAKKKFEELALGDILVLEMEHPRAVRNILDWACGGGTEVEVDELESGRWQMVLIKG